MKVSPNNIVYGVIGIKYPYIDISYIDVFFQPVPFFYSIFYYI